MILLKEPEYSDDEDFEGATEEDDVQTNHRGSKSNRDYDNVGGGIGFEPKPYRDSKSPTTGKAGVASNHMFMPPIDTNHKHTGGKNNVNSAVGGLPQIR